MYNVSKSYMYIYICVYSHRYLKTSLSHLAANSRACFISLRYFKNQPVSFPACNNLFHFAQVVKVPPWMKQAVVHGNVE